MWRLLVIMLVLAAVALVFVLDPAGVIAEYIIPDFGEMGWKQLTAWAFRVPGTGLALLLVIPLWILEFQVERSQASQVDRAGNPTTQWAVCSGGFRAGEPAGQRPHFTDVGSRDVPKRHAGNHSGQEGYAER